ncbi:MAG TPA: class I SAM-dependent methyltransferase [Clostridiaceae bacterium]|nr:class I SAM-dependent methyltransferase [Clostridiaceae bacterium]
MSFKKTACKLLNKVFPLPEHPLNLQNKGIMSLNRWQYQKGRETIKYYLERYSADDIFKDKTVLDIGCGAGGKTIYYTSLGASMVYGIDILPQYEIEANQLAQEKGLSDRFRFVVGDATHLSFDDNFFDTIIMNDSMEHVANPEEILKECRRVLKPGGRLYINFPPYYHPYGAHLSDAIGIPWVHFFFNENTLIEVYKELVSKLPDEQERIKLRISKDGSGCEYISYINKMTIARFQKILENADFSIDYYREVPLRKFLAFTSRIPVIKEGFVKMVVCVLKKPE